MISGNCFFLAGLNFQGGRSPVGPLPQRGKTANQGGTVPPTAKRMSMSLSSYVPGTQKMHRGGAGALHIFMARVLADRRPPTIGGAKVPNVCEPLRAASAGHQDIGPP